MAYGTDQGLIDYLAQTGRTLPDDAVPSAVRFYGSMWVDGFEDLFCGDALSDEASFPRDIYNPVPVRVEYASYEAGYAWATGAPLFGEGGTVGGQVIKEKVDVLEVQYATPEGGWWQSNRYIVPMAYAHLLPFICEPKDNDCGCGGGFAFIV